MSQAQKAQRIVQPRVAAGDRRIVVSKATGRVAAKSAVTGRVIAKGSRRAAAAAQRAK